MFHNKLDENGFILRSREILVAKGYNQPDGIDLNETYALVVILEAIFMLLAFFYIMGFKLFQMDVKSEFLNDNIQEEVYIDQPFGLKNIYFLNHVSN